METSAYTPFDVKTKDRIVGLFVIGAVLLFLLGFLIPMIQNLNDDSGIPFYTILDQTYGVAPEATVSLRGVMIGNVTQVAITKDGMVRVDLKLSDIYQDFYTRKSTLEIDTNIGVSMILTGSGLILSPGKPENGPMESGDFIRTKTPQGMSTLLEELDMVQITDQITEIIANIETITTGVAENQETIFRSLENLETVTENLSEVSAQLPAMVQSTDKTLIALQSSMEGVDGMVEATAEDLQLTLKNTVSLTEQATATLTESELLFKNARPLLQQMPTVLTTTDVALQSFTQLSDQLSRSWLLGGSDQTPVMLTVPGPHPHDDNLYQSSP